MQMLLYGHGNEYGDLIVASGGCDGSFGPGTLKALKAFQSANGLEADGKCGPMTWAKLLELG